MKPVTSNPVAAWFVPSETVSLCATGAAADRRPLSSVPEIEPSAFTVPGPSAVPSSATVYCAPAAKPLPLRRTARDCR